MKALIVWSVMFIGTSAHASGCGGGDWREFSRKDLAPLEIRTTAYGPPLATVEVYENNNAFVTWKVPAREKAYDFYSGTIPLAQKDLIFILKELGKLNSSITVSVHELVEMNHIPDDCLDLPVGAKRFTTTYSFALNLGGGQTQKFSAEHFKIELPATDSDPSDGAE